MKEIRRARAFTKSHMVLELFGEFRPFQKFCWSIFLHTITHRVDLKSIIT